MTAGRVLRLLRALLIAVAVLAVLGAAAFYWIRTQRARADLVLRGGRIITLDQSIPEAQALAAREGRIVAIGSTEDVAPHIGWWTRVIDLDGYVAVPVSSKGTGISRGLVNIRWASISATPPAGSRLSRWWGGRSPRPTPGTPQPNVGGFPTHQSLDRVSPDNPVVLRHAKGAQHGKLSRRQHSCAEASSRMRRHLATLGFGDTLKHRH